MPLKPISSPPAPLKQTLPSAKWLSYRIGRGEQGVLTFEPYKSFLLPYWRFRTAVIARQSAADLWAKFEEFDAQEDFVGMDMARKFVQMGMTRAKRYANHAGGRKYEYEYEDEEKDGGNKESDGVKKGKGKGEGERRRIRGKELPRSQNHPGKQEKDQASLIFREVWRRCRDHPGYRRRKVEFLKEQQEWMKNQPGDREGR